MNSGWDLLGKIATILGVGGGIGVAFWVLNIEWRIRTLEGTVQTLSTAPAVSRPGEPGPVANPLDTTCAELTKRIATALEGNRLTTASDLQRLHKETGCLPRN